MAAAYSTSGIVRCHSEFTAKLVSSQNHHLSATPPAAANSVCSNCSSYTSSSINRSNSNPRIATAVRQDAHPTPSCVTPHHHHPPTPRLCSRPAAAAAAAAAAHPPSRFSEVSASSSPSSSSSFSSRNRRRTRGRCSGNVVTSPSPCPSSSPSPSTSPSPCLSRQQVSTNEGDRLFKRVECHASSSRSFRHQLGVDSLPRGIERVVSRATWRSLRTCLSSSSATDAAEVDGTVTDSSASPSPSSPPPPPPPSQDAEPEEPIAFCDEGAEMDVRVRIPGELMPVESTDIRVVAEPGSLYVGIAKPDTEAVWLLEAPCLYSEIQPGDTVWFLDDESIVINLRKLNDQWKWPGLKQEWDTLSKGVAKLLKGSSVYVVGERTEVNACVTNELAPALGYVPLNTQQLVEQVTKMPISELAEDEGTVAEAEKAVLVGLSTHVRCVVSTIGGNEGATARTDGWNHLHCGVTVWVHCGAPDEDEETGRTIVTRAKMESSLPEPAPGTSYGKADVTVAVGSPQVRWESDATRPVAEGVLKAVKQLLERDSELPGKKGLYRRLGCRGDWPYIMPPGWNPNPSKEGEASESEPNELERLVESLEGSTSQSGISGVHTEVTELLQASQQEKDTLQEQQQQQTTAISS